MVLDSALGFVGFTYIRTPQKEENDHGLIREQCFTFIPRCDLNDVDDLEHVGHLLLVGACGVDVQAEGNKEDVRGATTALPAADGIHAEFHQAFSGISSKEERICQLQRGAPGFTFNVTNNPL